MEIDIDIAQNYAVETIQVKLGTTVRDVIGSAVAKVGIFSKLVDLDTVLKPNDRIEIYRPLIRDPKDRRRIKAAHAKTSRDSG